MLCTCNGTAAPTAIKSVTLQLCHPVDPVTLRKRDLKHPSFAQIRNASEDVMTLRDVRGDRSDSSLLRLLTELFTNTFMTPHQLSHTLRGGISL